MADFQKLWCFMSEEDKKARLTSKSIDKQLKHEKLQFRRTVKILLLGSGESGKSTFLKQMRIIHGKDFTKEERENHKVIIYGNIVKGMKVLIDARDKLNIAWEHEESIPHAKYIFSYESSTRLTEYVFLEYVPSMRQLWQDHGIRTAFDRRREYQLGDSLQYFLDGLDRIGQQGYVPNRTDILHSRKATKGIAEHQFIIKNVPFHFVDVGGQRSQRQKWYQCFEGVTSILFLVSSSEFDQVLFEDRQTNRLVESCNIFETIVNNRAFAKVSIILFLNKQDLLARKIQSVSIRDFFPQFQGNPRSLTDVQEFELSLFDSRRRERVKPLFHHFTTAVDTENIRFVFQAVKDTILQDNLNSLMLQ